MSKRSFRLRIGPRSHHPEPMVADPAPDIDTLDDLVRACRALTRDPGSKHAAETHRRVVRRARATHLAGRD